MNKYNKLSNKICIKSKKEFIGINSASICKECHKVYCIDCGKLLAKSSIYNNTKRCYSCARIIHGKYYNQNFCIDCNTEIASLTAVKGHSRCHSCAEKAKSQEQAPNWQGGVSFEEYNLDWTKELREKIRIRDNHKCQLCNKKEIELIGFHKKLPIHHIDYNKRNCKENNLITLCLHCNIKVNFNRDYWFSYFTYIMENILCLN